MNRSQFGLTLIETVIALAIGGLLLGGLGATLWQFQRLPAWASAQLVVAPELRNATNWIRLDANKAQSFAAGTGAWYGTFRWLDYGTFPPTSYEVQYYLGGNTLYRQVSINAVASEPETLVRHIANQSNVTFTPSASKLTANITATIDSGIMGVLTRSSAIAVEMRPEPTDALEYLLYYLHNNPTPPTGNTISQINLPLDSTKSTATTLYNYDTNRDALPGLYVMRSAAGGNLNEGDTLKFQDWRMTATLSSTIVIDGQTSLFLYGAATGFGTGKTMTVDAWLRDFDPATSIYTTIGIKGNAGFVSQSTWTAISVHFSKVVYTVPAGHKLALKIQFDGTSATEGMIAYDTTSYLAFLLIPTQP